MISKHLFFDLDRTLWDFDKNSKIALNQLFFELKLDETIADFDHFHSVYKINNAELWKQYGNGNIKKEFLREERFRSTLENFKLKDPKLIKKMSDGYVAISPYQTSLFPNTIETLSQLKKSGFNMHIITNGFKEVQEIKIRKSGLESYFDIIVCSEDVGKNKPSPDIFHYSLNKANAKKEASVMIGDDYEIDVLGALNIGMSGILFDPFRNPVHQNEKNKIHELSELPDLLPWVFRSKL